jgi:hypothetical protein
MRLKANSEGGLARRFTLCYTGSALMFRDNLPLAEKYEEAGFAEEITDLNELLIELRRQLKEAA